MAEQKVVNYIEEVVHKGLSIKQAEDKLIQVGYKKEVVEKASSKVRMKKFEKRGAFILGVIIVLGLSGLLIDKYYPIREFFVEQPVNSFEKLGDAIASGNIDSCDEFNPAKKGYCENKVLGVDTVREIHSADTISKAAETNDPSLCENIQSPVEKSLCLSGAESSNPEDESSEIEPEKTPEEEIIEEASSTGDTSLCDSLTDPVKKKICLLESS